MSRLIRLPGAGFVRRVVSSILSVKSARGVSFTLAIVSLSSKPLGYLRMLIIAWAFGTASGMDAFYLVSGIITLFAGSTGSSMESAVLPELERLRAGSANQDVCRALVAFVAWVLAFLTLLLCAVFILVPEPMIRFFAGGFDPERVRMGALMLWWLIPFTIVTMYRPLLGIWSLFTERYTLATVCSVVFNFVAIPSLLILIPLVGVYAVAGSMSLGYGVSFLIFLLALGGIPARFTFAILPRDSLWRIARNMAYILVITSAETLYVMVDRYFASRLPAGSVAAISYGNSILGIISLATAAPLVFFLAKISRTAADDREAAEKIVRQTIAITVGYFMPVSFLTAAAATPIVSLIYGWGNFDAQSVYMTSICLTAYSFGLAAIMCITIVYRYVQATQKLGLIVIISYLFVLVNGVLDWVLVERYGLVGLAFATSITQVLSFVAYYSAAMSGSFFAFLLSIRFFHQLFAVACCALAARMCASLGIWIQLIATIAIGILYLVIAEKSGLMRSIPEHWRPSKLFLFFFANIASFFRQHGSGS